MAQQSKALPAFLTRTPRSAYIMAYRAERLMYQIHSVGDFLTEDAYELFLQMQQQHPEAARNASVSFQLKFYADPLGYPRKVRPTRSIATGKQRRVRRLPASRLPGIQPEDVRKAIEVEQALRYLNSHI